MKWINPGILALFPITSKGSQVENPKAETTETGFAIATDGDYRALYPISSSEFWCSYNYYITRTRSEKQASRDFFRLYKDATTPFLDIRIKYTDTGRFIEIQSIKGDNYTSLYTSEGTIDVSAKMHNIEMHYKAGENGRVDIWIDHKLFCSFRSPTALPTTPNYISIAQSTPFYGDSAYDMYISSIILQDTRRIGYEKFKMLTVNPATEQNMPQGSTTNYTVSGLSDATEFSDITSFGAIMQTTSKDANITTGTFSLNGSEIGTIDVSDSSGKAYEIAHSESNPATTKPWTRDDIEGKTLSFTVNGAS